MKSLIELRVLAGAALGARTGLDAGDHSVGSGEDCDIVLAADKSLEKHHARLSVRKKPEAEKSVEVWVALLSTGRAAIDGVEVPSEGASLPSGAVLSLGFTALAWRLPGEFWPPITLVPLEFAQAALEKAPKKTEGENASPTANATANSTANAGQSLAPTANETAPESPGEGEPPVRSWKRWAGLAGLLLLLLILGALFFFWRDSRPLLSPAQSLREALAVAGFTGIVVRVDPVDGGLLRIDGEVTNDRELLRLRRIAGEQRLRVRLDVRVRDDFLRAMRETLNAHGFYPTVWDLPPAPDAMDETPRIALALYLKDSLTETQMLSLAKDTPGLNKALRKVAYASDVAPLLEKELDDLGMEKGKIDYLAGKVLMSYQLSPEMAMKLAASLDRVQETLGVPIVFEKANLPSDEPVAPPESEVWVDLDVVPDESDPLGGLEVMSITSGGVPFVTLSDRQTLFTGAKLPNGAVLTGIFTDRLEFLKDDEPFTFFLKENPHE